MRASIFVIGVPFSLFPFDTNNSTRVGAPCQALVVCPSPHFRAPYGTVGYPTVEHRGPHFTYVGVTYPNGTYSDVGVSYGVVTYHPVPYAYVDVTYTRVTYHPVTYPPVTYLRVTFTYVTVTYGYVGKGCH